MPTPIEILLDPVSITILVMYAALAIWEVAAPARALPLAPWWRLRGLVGFIAFFYLSTYLPLFWDVHLVHFQLFDLEGLGTWGGAFIGLLVYETVLYGWHRAMHASDGLFLAFHQMHHSAERLDTWGAFYFSPADMIGFTFVGSLSLVVVVGISPSAATVVIMTTTFLGIFQHANIRTPRWLGYLVQRPEAHSLHHGRGVHRYNYADLPILDMLFGTFQNPSEYVSETGFYPGASTRVPEMILMKDVSTPRS